MIIDVALSGLHLRRPSPTVHHIASTAVGVASSVGWALAAITVVGYGFGRHLAVLLSVVVLLYAGYAVGTHRANAAWSARHRRVLEQVQRANSAQHRETARRLAELSAYAEADRDPHRSRKDRHINSSRTRTVAGLPTEGSQ